jgi:amyloid beta precursor protein binding protein 1
VGTEILKDLVLPGIGSFTLIDPGVVQLSDCGSNFFVTEDRIGEVCVCVVLL